MNRAGARAISRSQAVRDELESRAERISAAAAAAHDADGYAAHSEVGSTRARAVVVTTDLHAVNSNRLHNTLLKSLGAGR